MTRKTLTPAQKAHMAIQNAIRDAMAVPGTVTKADVLGHAAIQLELDGMAEDTAADLVEKVWRNEFEIMGAN